MKKAVIIRYSEIGLKGANRPYFENKLIENIKLCLEKNKTPYSKIKNIRGRIILLTENNADFLKNVFGIASFSYASIAEKSMESIKKAALNIAEKKDFRTFRISAQRGDKNFSKTSPEIEKEIGSAICEKLEKKVSLDNFDLEIGIEVFDRAYIFFEKTQCLGGLPLGSQGKVIALVENKNSELAASLMMKRGCEIIPLSYKKHPLKMIEKLSYRKSPLKIIRNEAEIVKIAEKESAKAVVLGQTFEEYKKTRSNILMLRPLIGFSKEMIEKEIKRFSS